MDVYIVMHGPVQLPAGTLLRLSDTQITTRRRALRLLEYGWCLALSNLTFETGEVLTLDHPPSAEILPSLTPPELLRPIHAHPNHRLKRREHCHAS